MCAEGNREDARVLAKGDRVTLLATYLLDRPRSYEGGATDGCLAFSRHAACDA